MIKKILYPIGLLIILLFLIFLVNQLVAIYNNLSQVHPALGIIGTSILGLLVLILLVVPFILLVKLPAPLPFPENDLSLELYKLKFRQRLARHPIALEHRLNPELPDQLDKINGELKKQADKIIFDHATAVFISTAISQNGKLDAFTVLAAQIRLIWKVSHVYWQRPSWKNLRQLYTNVAFSAMAASSIEQMDLSQQIQPILNAVVKSPGKHIPVIGSAAHIITDSILEGTVNAFLTLRIGVLTKNYCHPEVRTINDIKTNSFLEASTLLKTLVVKSSAKVAEGILKAGKNASIHTFKTGYGAVEKVVRSARSGISGLFSTSEEPADNK